MYMFFLSVIGDYNHLNANLMLDDKILATSRAHWDHISQGSVLVTAECLSNQKVWVKMSTRSDILGTSAQLKGTSFSGFLSFVYV